MRGEASKAQPTRGRRKPLQVVVKNGEPSAVILDIKDYQEMLERLEDVDDLKVLERTRKRALRFRRLEEFLAEHAPGV